MIDRDHKLPIKRQAKLLDISRGTVYYRPRPIIYTLTTLSRQQKQGCIVTSSFTTAAGLHL
jgi:hypothetical protein